jgi:hypothetical protein
MTTARGFFYDDCRSADRLAREYTLRGSGVAPVAYIDNGVFCYRWVAVAGTKSNYTTIQSFTPSGEFEITYKLKKNLQSPEDAWIPLDIYYSWRSTTDLYLTDISDQLYFWRYTPIATYYSYSPATGGPFTQDVWYNVKFRCTTKLSQLKTWLVGVAEPNWDVFNSKSVVLGNEKPLKITRPPGAGLIGIGGATYHAGDVFEMTDIRITPVPKTGGP